MLNIFNYNSLQEVLLDEISVRKQKNPQYSNRAFARDIGISIGMISGVLNSKKGLSTSMAYEIGKKLKYCEEENQYFVALARAYSESNDIEKLKYLAYIRKHGSFYNRDILPEKDLSLLNNWYSLLIFSALDYDHFRTCSELIASTLGIELLDVQKTLDSLEELGIISCVDGEYKKLLNSIEFKSEVPSKSIQNYHLSQLFKTHEMIKNSNIENRYLKNLSFSFDKKFQKEITQKIDLFINDLSNYQNIGAPQSLISVNVGSLFFPVEDNDLEK
jgi:uncharacterized protein (TIGR02147 family)